MLNTREVCRCLGHICLHSFCTFKGTRVYLLARFIGRFLLSLQHQLPDSPNFSSGPCKKRPGYDVANLPLEVLGRSHRSKLGKARLKKAIDDSARILGIPDDYQYVESANMHVLTTPRLCASNTACHATTTVLMRLPSRPAPPPLASSGYDSHSCIISERDCPPLAAFHESGKAMSHHALPRFTAIPSFCLQRILSPLAPSSPLPANHHNASPLPLPHIPLPPHPLIP